MFANFSTNTLKRNQTFVNNLFSFTNKKKTKRLPKDIKYQPNEGARALYVASMTQYSKFLSASPNMIVDDIGHAVLKTQNEFYKNIEDIKSNYKQDLNSKKGKKDSK